MCIILASFPVLCLFCFFHHKYLDIFERICVMKVLEVRRKEESNFPFPECSKFTKNTFFFLNQSIRLICATPCSVVIIGYNGFKATGMDMIALSLVLYYIAR